MVSALFLKGCKLYVNACMMVSMDYLLKDGVLIKLAYYCQCTSQYYLPECRRRWLYRIAGYFRSKKFRTALYKSISVVLISNWTQFFSPTRATVLVLRAGYKFSLSLVDPSLVISTHIPRHT